MKTKLKKIIGNKFVKKFVLHFGCAIITFSWLAYNNKTCDLSDNLTALSSINQTNSEDCRLAIRQFACSRFDRLIDPKCQVESSWKGCTSRENINSLNSSTGNAFSAEICLKKCISFSNSPELMAAFDSYSNSCVCFSNKMNDSSLLNDCDGVDNNFTVYSISFPGLIPLLNV